MRSSAVSGVLALALVAYVSAQASPCAQIVGGPCASSQTCLLVSTSGGAGVYACVNTPCGAATCNLATQYCDATLTCQSNSGAPAPVSGGSASGGSSLTGSFMPGLPSFGTGGFGSSCASNTDCTQQGFTCVGGFCLPGPNADCPSACDTGFSCSYGVCVPNVNAPCDPACASGSTCVFGQCIPSGPVCSPTCATGYVCAGQQFGCIATAAATCSPACSNGFTCVAGICVPPAPSCSGTCTAPQYCGPDVSAYTGVNPFSASAGAALTWKCLSPPGSAASATCSPACNSNTQICAMGTCVSKPPFSVGTGAGAVAQSVIDAMLCGSINLALLPTPSAAPMTGTAASFAGAAFAQIDASASVNWPSLTFAGSAAAAASAQSALTIGASAQVQAMAFTASLPNVACIVNSAARMAIAAATVAVNSTVTWSFAAAADASAAAGVVSLDQLDLSGSIIVTGSGRFQFPLNPALVTVARGAGVVQFSGGATLSGNAATAAVQVSGGATGSSTVYVSAAQGFTTAGNILGSSGSVQVNGQFAFAGASIQPAVHVNSAGVWTINGTACQTGEVRIAAGGSVNVRANGRGVRMGVIRSCEAGAQITYYASGTFAAGTASSGTISFYSAGTSTTSFACGVRVIDESGAVADLTVASNPRTSSWGGNIFTASQGSATFGAQSLTYTGAQANGAATTAPTTLALAAALVIAAAGRYLM